MERLGIIHLSDTQFGKKHVFGSPSKLSQALAEDIAAMARQHGFVPLYLLVSGDISETAHGEEFADAARELARTARQSDIDVRSVLSIPGNHDVSWPLATVAAQVGNPDLPLENYRRFLSTLSAFDGPAQPGTTEQREVVHDHRHGITFLLMNSCRKESPTCHVGHVDPDTIAAAIAKIDSRPDARDYLRIAVLHHRLDSTVPGAATQVENAEEVEAMLMASGFSVVLTGHVHQGMCHIVEKANRRIAYSGCGSTGVDKTQRPEGVPNQYTIHVLDRGTNSLETIWRAYNPRSLGRLGLGAWTKDNTTDEPLARLALAEWRRVARVKRDHLRDSSLERRLRITSNPFVYSNAEKIADDLLLELFVSDDTRHQSAKRLSGDAIIRGPRGSGKTMFLRFLHLYGLALFEQAVRSQETAECFPVTVNLSRLHRSDLAQPLMAYSAADQLVYDSVTESFERCNESLNSLEFRAALHRFRQKLANLSEHSGTLVSKLGTAIRDALTPFLRHVLLLIDEASILLSARRGPDIPWLRSRLFSAVKWLVADGEVSRRGLAE